MYALLGATFSCAYILAPFSPASQNIIYRHQRHDTSERIFASSAKPFIYSCSKLRVSTERNLNESKESEDTDVSMDSVVLQNIYPSLLEYIEQYGHPNIPLGTTQGRACHTLRRLKIQGKLTDNDADILLNLGFRFTFDNIYEDMHFEEILGRLLEYEGEHRANFQIPKKYAPDPELGAWVAAVRRIGRDAIDASEREALDSVGFAWVSTRKCGSTFMVRLLIELQLNSTSLSRNSMINDISNVSLI